MLIYADDIILVEKIQAALQKYLKACERHIHRNKYVFTPEKYEVIATAYRVGSEIISSTTLASTEIKYTDTLIILESLSVRRVSI